MKLAESDYSSQFRIIMYLQPQLVIGPVIIKQFLLQMGAHVGHVDVHSLIKSVVVSRPVR